MNTKTGLSGAKLPTIDEEVGLATGAVCGLGVTRSAWRERGELSKILKKKRRQVRKGAEEGVCGGGLMLCERVRCVCFLSFR